jgi:maltooligosyltrehalose trehalohydrolase
LHIGTFSAEGTFEGAIAHLDALQELGITAVELMPIAQFPGARNWGYDGVFPFAPQNTYGGPTGLRKLVDACHARGMAIIIDAVYNHFGPEGNYFWGLGAYFTDKYHTPWGQAINVDGAGSLDVRRLFIKNALYWITEFHADALRLDAIHAIYDFSAQPFLKELADAVRNRAERLGRAAFVIGESDLNDSRVVAPWEKGGYGLSAAWSDDFHHAVHALLTGEDDGYYHDFGTIEDLVKALAEGYVYDGRFSNFRQRPHGNSSMDIPPQQLVISIQNHDQIGNRMNGDRLSKLVSFEKLKLGAGLMLLSPYTPMIFMGEEYGESAPFLYFIDHSDQELVKAVQKGRQQEFSSFKSRGTPPDPQAIATFKASKLNHALRQQGAHHRLWMLYRELINRRKSMPALGSGPKDFRGVTAHEEVLFVHQRKGDQQVFIAYNLGDKPIFLESAFPLGRWTKELDSSDPRWTSEQVPAVNRSSDPAFLAPHAFALFKV